MSRRTLDQDRAAVDAQTTRFLDAARALDPHSLGDDSLCEGWSRGHVLSHVARNGDALTNLVTAATTGERVPMYASAEARDADIQAGSGRPLDEQLADIEATAARLREALAALTEDISDVRVEARGGVMVRAGSIPLMRLREIVIHGVDLRGGLDFAGVDDDVALALLEDAVRRLRNNPETPSLTIRTGEGDAWSIGDGQPTVSGSRAAVLGWVTRGLTDGVTGDLPTLPFGG